MSSSDIAERTLPLRLCTIVSPTGETLKPLVRCPRSDSSIDAHKCAGCMRMRSLEWDPERGGEVQCVTGADAPTVDRRADFAELAARTHMHEIGARVATFVTERLPVERARAIFAKSDEPALAVVDEDGRLAGLLVRAAVSEAVSDAVCDAVVGDVMAREVQVLPEDAPISLALSVFAYDRIAAAPIVRLDGLVTGMCRADDLLRWVAARLGYAPPAT